MAGMPDYIDRRKAVAYLNDIRLTVGPDQWTAPEDIPMARARYEGLTDAIDAIVELPSADVRPVVRGKWILKDWGFEYSECSVCGFEHRYSEQFNFCPNCGAKMDKDGDGE